MGAKDYVGEKAHGVKEALVGSAHHVKDATAEKLTEAKEYVEGSCTTRGPPSRRGCTAQRYVDADGLSHCVPSLTQAPLRSTHRPKCTRQRRERVADETALGSVRRPLWPGIRLTLHRPQEAVTGKAHSAGESAGQAASDAKETLLRKSEEANEKLEEAEKKASQGQ